MASPTYKLQEPLRGGNVPTLVDAFTFRIDEYLHESKKETISWLDIGCGRGYLLESVCRPLGGDCSRLAYTGYDCAQDFVDVCNEKLSTLPLRSAEVLLGEFDDIAEVVRGPFDIISVVEVLSDLHLHLVPKLILDIFQLSGSSTLLFISDLLKLPHPSNLPGALSWQLAEINAFISRVANLLHMDSPPRARPGTTGKEGSENAWALIFKELPNGLANASIHDPETRRTLTRALFDIFENRRKTLNGEVENKVRVYRKALRESMFRYRTPSSRGLRADFLTGDRRAAENLDIKSVGAAAVERSVEMAFQEYWACESEVYYLGTQ